MKRRIGALVIKILAIGLMVTGIILFLDCRFEGHGYPGLQSFSLDFFAKTNQSNKKQNKHNNAGSLRRSNIRGMEKIGYETEENNKGEDDKNGEEDYKNARTYNRTLRNCKGKIAITFDDGPYPNLTRQLLDGLKERNVKATFFVIGENVKLYPDVIEKMYLEGHLIGNHTYHHVQLTKVGNDKFREELITTNEEIEKITGMTPNFIRPPYGSWNENLEKELYMIPVLWTIDPLDWKCKDENLVYERVVTSASENDIILLHDCYESSVLAALRIIDELKKQGYEFVTVDQLLLD